VLHDEALQHPYNLRSSAPAFAKLNVQILFTQYEETHVHIRMGSAKPHVRLHKSGGGQSQQVVSEECAKLLLIPSL